MKQELAVEIVTKLADGIDPLTGNEISSDSPYQNADTVRALNMALQALQHGGNARVAKPDGPGKAGKAWSEEDEKVMIDMFDAKEGVIDIAKKLDRTRGAIWARLEKVGRVARDESGRLIRAAAPAEASAPSPDRSEKDTLPELDAVEF